METRITAEMVDRGATAIANARGRRRGQHYVKNIRDLVGAKRWAELLEDSECCLKAALKGEAAAVDAVPPEPPMESDPRPR